MANHEHRQATLTALRQAHTQTWSSTSDEAWGRPGICAEDEHPWPCDTATALALLADQDHRQALTDLAARLRADGLTLAATYVEYATDALNQPAREAKVAAQVTQTAHLSEQISADLAAGHGPQRTAPTPT